MTRYKASIFASPKSFFSIVLDIFQTRRKGDRGTVRLVRRVFGKKKLGKLERVSTRERGE